MKMGTRITLMITILIVTGIAVATSARGVRSVPDTMAACCCCSGESCPMKGKDAASTKETGAADQKCGCCKDDSCPMKKKDTAAKGMVKDAAMSCDKCACCKGDSCAIKKSDHHKGAEAKMNHADKAHDEAKGCCACCHKDKAVEKKNVAVTGLVTFQTW